MLHAMRRNSFLGGIFRFILWAAAIGIPIWFYLQYLAPILTQAMGTLNQMQGQVQSARDAGAQLSVPFSQFSDMVDKLKSYLPEDTQQ